jgi:hypothetical protein
MEIPGQISAEIDSKTSVWAPLLRQFKAGR